MKRSSLDLLACPECHYSLSLQAVPSNPIVTDGLGCLVCQKEYTITAGIPRFIFGC